MKKKDKHFKEVTYYVGVDVLNFPIYITHRIPYTQKSFKNFGQ